MVNTEHLFSNLPTPGIFKLKFEIFNELFKQVQTELAVKLVVTFALNLQTILLFYGL